MSFHYSPKIVTDGLILYLDAANKRSYSSDVTWSDLSVNDYTHSLINSPTFSITNGGSIRFDGTNEFVSHYYSSGDKYHLGITKKMTIDIWIKWDQLVRNLDGGIAYGLLFGNASVGHLQWQFFKHVSGSNTRWSFGVVNTTSGYYLNQINGDPTFTPSVTMMENTWYNFTYTYNGFTPTIVGYINGLTAGGSISGTNPTTFANPVTFDAITLGGSLQGLYSQLGNIGIVRVYNRDLSPSEVLQNYNSNKSRFGL